MAALRASKWCTMGAERVRKRPPALKTVDYYLSGPTGAPTVVVPRRGSRNGLAGCTTASQIVD